MTGIEIYSASPLSAASSDQLWSTENAKEAGESISRGTSVSPDTAETASGQDAQDQMPASVDASARPFAPMSSRSVPRLNTRASISDAPLPWKIDETSSPCTPISHGRKASYALPPPRVSYRSSADNSKANYTYSPPAANSFTYSPPHSTTSSIPTPGSHTVDLSHPPGYTQDASSSFSDRAHGLSYDNSTPFYQNNHNSYSSRMSSPITPTRRGRGILDNDPNLYLRGEADTEDETYWDTAARWAKAAGKRMSQGEQQLWRIVSAATHGEDRYDR